MAVPYIVYIYIYMNLWLELDTSASVAQLVRELHRNRRFDSCQKPKLHFSQLFLVRSE